MSRQWIRPSVPLKSARSLGVLALSGSRWKVPASAILATLFALGMASASRAASDGLPVSAPRDVAVNGRDLARSQVQRPPSTEAAPDSDYVGFTPGHVGAGNYWSIWSGSGPGFHRPAGQGGMWDWESPVNGDSLQGWTPIHLNYTLTGGLTLPDDQRPWWALDVGNSANYSRGAGNNRTAGVVGIWHVENGSASGGGVTWNTSDWGGPANGRALWCGLRRQGDLSFLEDAFHGGTGNPFNAGVLTNTGGGGNASSLPTDQKFPGYGSQWDQLAYTDFDVTGKATIQLRFKYRTRLSTAYTTAAATRTGWFDKDPLGPADQTNPASLNNFISSSAAGIGAPIDSFMIYVGAPVGYAAGSSWKGSDGITHLVYDAKRRWLSETIRVNEPTVPYHEVFTTYGDHTVANQLSLTVPVEASWGNRVRVVLRCKTNRGFDDESGSVPSAYSSGGGGGVVIDDIEVTFNGSSFALLDDFEGTRGVDNRTSVDPLAAWKTTGKPPGVYFHSHNISDLLYEDIFGPAGSATRICNLDGNVISSGDHDRSEAAGGVFGQIDEELINGIASPAIQLAGPYTGPGDANPIGLTQATVDATDDMLADWEIYTGITDLQFDGNSYSIGVQSYPANDANGQPGWGPIRVSSNAYFDPTKECFRQFEPLLSSGLVRTSNPSGIPDSIRLVLTKTQQCFRFGLPSASCSSAEGLYWDNVSLVLTNVPPGQGGIGYYVSDANPSTATDCGIAPLTIFGAGFQPGVAVHLSRSGSSDIPVSLNEVLPFRIQGRMDLTGAASGTWDIVITNPGPATVSLSSFLSVLPASQASGLFISSADALQRMRSGTQQTANVMVDNHATSQCSDLAFLSVHSNPGIGPVTVSLASIPVGVFSEGPPSGDPLIGDFVIPTTPGGVTWRYSLGFTAPAPIYQGELRLKLFDVPAPLSGSGASGAVIAALVETGGQQQGFTWPTPGAGFRSAFEAELYARCHAQVTAYSANTAANSAIATVSEFIRKAIDDALTNLNGGWATDVAGYRTVWNTLETSPDWVTFAVNLETYAAMIASPPAPPSGFPGGTTRLQFQCVASLDPNDKVGPWGQGAEHWIGGTQPLPYTLHFENRPDASAPAAEVTVTDVLDSLRYDLSTFEFGRADFGSNSDYPPSGSQEHTADYDLRPGQDLILRLHEKLNRATAIVTATFTSLDPATMQLPEDPGIGFLPPNVTNPAGAGSISFKVALRSGLSTGDEVRNMASVVFDNNAPLDTPEWLNTLDLSAPQSAVLPLPATIDSLTFTVGWGGTDAGSGIASYNIYSRKDGGPYTLWQRQTKATAAQFTGIAGGQYDFYSVAEDLVGHIEDAPGSPDASTTLSGSTGVPSERAAILEFRGAWPNPAVGEVALSFSLRTAAPARLDIMDVSGRLLLTREVGALGPGSHVMRIPAGNLGGAGLCFARLTQSGESKVSRFVFLKR